MSYVCHKTAASTKNKHEGQSGEDRVEVEYTVCVLWKCCGHRGMWDLNW